MALVDAVAKSIGIPLWRLFGGASNTITTDITVQFLSSFIFFCCCPLSPSLSLSFREKQNLGEITYYSWWSLPEILVSICYFNLLYLQIPIVSPAEAHALATKYQKQGFKTLKLKVGKNLKADIKVLQAIRAAHPDCSFILDANEGYRPEEAIEVLARLHGREYTGNTKLRFSIPAMRKNEHKATNYLHVHDLALKLLLTCPMNYISALFGI